MPFRELSRLKTAQRLLTIEINEENELRDLAKIAAELCHVPAAVISLVNGIQIIEGVPPIGIEGNLATFYEYVIKVGNLVVLDEIGIKASGPVSSGEKNNTTLRFLAGIPFISQEGQILGTLCLMDKKPNILAEIQVRIIEILSRQATRVLEFAVSTTIFRELYQDAKVSENKIRSFFESSACCHLLLGIDFTILAFNKALEEFVKDALSINVTEGMDIRILVHPAHLDRFTDNYQTARNGTSVRSEVELFYKGKQIYWSINYEPAHNSDGEIIGVSYNAIDITERVRQEKLVSAQNSSLKEIAFIQSHELRRPLSTILGMIELIEIENYKVWPNDLSILKLAAKELDEKIKKIVELTDDLQNNY